MFAGLGESAVLDWMTGVAPPPAAVTGEVAAQLERMIAALRADAAAPGATFTATGRPTVVSGHRDYTRQERIWSRKFDFEVGVGRFGAITDEARAAFPALGAAVEWDTADDTHRTCWEGLSAEERGREIMRTSSGPGISRHHWGTDLDLWNTSAVHYADGGSLANEYSWLTRHAAAFGFIQPFTARSAAVAHAYTEERWHWSYRPVAEPMLEWVDAHRSTVDTRLRTLWGNSARYAFLRAHWAEFVFHVER
ncbi:D-alanyl-D-alanine carboxypeptidase family protein [Virgisporangium aliadipatigenens]|uniref:D-alanyl-D-alanine carboxypeptidase family protein n=1 Tax=Virgisporangium aliadipatigenens TaxID=741659 RepID=UPI00194121EB|nr:D-alanyl-D-alanine carboxypeptidase family protein [Virgisporangium aliadipatigenens]